ncbi:MAG TPA: accessory gene regulator B family protein [Candidatus Eisenbergiella merdavium]|uniref:Accessory gene regulator B family protein n=1 Tax=Candidatus Eisenbergiella merdavium TaxID=2838551 RepID=A0A9D2NEI3_9FIRM|nr:accessory gene regulator B family protein [Candidatus Eisenbergiella merdavium]
MEKIAETLTNFLLESGEIAEEDYQIYKYGFTVMLEKGIFLALCLGFAISLNKEIISILFFFIFIPLRSFAGGLHLDHYITCLILSVLSYLFVLLMSNILISPEVTILISVFALMCISLTYPVENINRKVDDKEKKVFEKKFCRCIIGNYFLVFLLFFLQKSLMLLTCAMTFLVITATMILGKIKNKYKNIMV